jgi:Skp family chaperone for outer membrane proteins
MPFTKCGLANSQQNIHAVDTGRIHKSCAPKMSLSEYKAEFEKRENKCKAEFLAVEAARAEHMAKAQRKKEFEQSAKEFRAERKEVDAAYYRAINRPCAPPAPDHAPRT